jgi:hypothetical protein
MEQKLYWVMEVTDWEDFEEKINNPPADYELHSWAAAYASSYFYYTIVFKLNARTERQTGGRDANR